MKKILFLVVTILLTHIVTAQAPPDSNYEPDTVFAQGGFVKSSNDDSAVLKKSAFTEIANTMDAMGWALMFLGWLLYWIKKLDEVKGSYKKENKPDWFAAFKSDNGFEILTSIVSCFALAILSAEIPTDIIDMKGRISVLIIGYSSSSIINGLITKGKQLKR
jgi:hypothetical protein